MTNKAFILSFLFICLFKYSHSQTTNNETELLNYVKAINISSSNFEELLPQITKPGNTVKEKLNLVYFWVFEHINFDTERFLKTGPLQPLSTTETLASGNALCYDYNELLGAACNYLKIPGYDIEGYVKYYGFEPGGKFTQNNHIWHAVYLDNKWQMIDLLWACGNLSIKGDNYTFIKKLQKAYFLADPATFLNSHLPADPIWQFTTHPLTIDGFVADKYDVDSTKRGGFIDYADSIALMNKLKPNDREIRSALRVYNFNKDNPNQLIITYYNSAVEMLNKTNNTKGELLKAKTYFANAMRYIKESTDNDIKALAPVCEKGIIVIERRLKQTKG
ncbi:transglutaminase domain-containing protein [Mucilaginibacter segetis]|uniref:Transglutaminase-like domain-containing protein n=1 Tax=Mucilaginibacter segetis TaxID=2793071 RepID=A0A934PQG7_9SPHI|nr:transglutaminase domain-containing protein [Mucilaginibacter segetis]MBK0378874.1 hypothetical protein [Mucilaginibacter segetis]